MFSSAVYRAEPLARGGGGGTGGRLGYLLGPNPRSSYYGGSGQVNSGGIETPIGRHSSVQTGCLRARDPLKLSIGGIRLLSSSTKQGPEKNSRSEKFKAFVKKEWDNMDSRSKFNLLELVAKCVLLGFGGGWGLMLAYTVIARVDKAEVVVQNVTEALEAMKVRSAESEKKSEKHRSEVDEKYEKLRLEFNELRSFKDLWLAFAFERERASVAAQGSPESK